MGSAAEWAIVEEFEDAGDVLAADDQFRRHDKEADKWELG